MIRRVDKRNHTSGRKLKSTIICLIVVVIILTIACILVTRGHEKKSFQIVKHPKTTFSLSEIFNSNYQVKDLSGFWIQGSERFLQLNNNGDIVEISLTSPYKVVMSKAFVLENNLYIQNINGTVKQLTFSRKENSVFTGIPDTSYENLLSKGIAIYWSKKDSFLAFAQFNLTFVPKVNITVFGEQNCYYPRSKSLFFSLAGHIDKPSCNIVQTTRVSLFVFELASGNKMLIYPPENLRNQDHYFLQLSWRDENHFLITWTNRIQNLAIVNFCSISANVHCVLPWPKPVWTESGESYLTILDRQEDNTSYFQLTLISVSTASKGLITFLTKGKQDIIHILGYDEKLSVVYYQITGIDYRTRYIFSLQISEKNITTAQCITCRILPSCTYASGKINSLSTYMIHACYGPSFPRFDLVNLKEYQMKVLEDNKHLKDYISSKLLPDKRYEKVAIGDKYDAWMEILYPPDFDPSKKYPALIYT
ncbi:DgyrCDS2310 [Dimorphilus gyrociliatus]|uniref:DgyrCDS2310 n=1 Tax=Dimorphilus gyrociliatus TaxID=2664684 RepID=A0A7I8VA32_9ANNE|nr:DgyrCDS2310 [Dimorphilus gyrociliatus]